MFQEIITRADARERGLRHYFTGKPCKHGHIANRDVSKSGCVECKKDESKRHYKNNREKVIDRIKKYKTENSDKLRNSDAKTKAEYYAKHKDRLRKLACDYYAKNAHKIKKKISDYKLNNYEKVIAQAALRRAVKVKRKPAWFHEFDNFVMMESHRLARLRINATGIDWHVDHMIPLMARKASGLHCASNLQVIPATLNLKKHNRMIFTEPGEWIKAL